MISDRLFLGSGILLHKQSAFLKSGGKTGFWLALGLEVVLRAVIMVLKSWSLMA